MEIKLIACEKCGTYHDEGRFCMTCNPDLRVDSHSGDWNKIAELEKELEESDAELDLAEKALDKEMTKNEQLQSIVNLLPHCMGEWTPNEDGMRYHNKKCERLATYCDVIGEYSSCDEHVFKSLVHKELPWASAVRVLEPVPVKDVEVEAKTVRLPVIK